MSIFAPELESNKAEQREQKEAAKEAEKDPELQAAAALERADYLVREVKTSQNQMQNIVSHMQAVLTAIRDLRSALQLTTTAGVDDASVIQDKKRVAILKARILKYKEELLKMKDDLIAEQLKLLREQRPTHSTESLTAEAEKMVQDMLTETEKE